MYLHKMILLAPLADLLAGVLKNAREMVALH
jgi:hypothetical protein